MICGTIYKYLYGLVILVAIFTTAVSAGYTFLNNVSSSNKKFFIYSILLCIMSICFCSYGFSNLLNLLYPILGFLGLFQIIIIVVCYIKN